MGVIHELLKDVLGCSGMVRIGNDGYCGVSNLSCMAEDSLAGGGGAGSDDVLKGVVWC